MKRLMFVLGAIAALAAGCQSPEQEQREAEKARDTVRRTEEEARKDVEEAKRKADEKIADARNKAAEAEAEAKRAADREYQAYADKIGKRLSAFDNDVSDLKSDLARAEGKTKQEAAASLQDLEARRAALQ